MKLQTLNKKYWLVLFKISKKLFLLLFSNTIKFWRNFDFSDYYHQILKLLGILVFLQSHSIDLNFYLIGQGVFPKITQSQKLSSFAQSWLNCFSYDIAKPSGNLTHVCCSDCRISLLRLFQISKKIILTCVGSQKATPSSSPNYSENCRFTTSEPFLQLANGHKLKLLEAHISGYPG